MISIVYLPLLWSNEGPGFVPLGPRTIQEVRFLGSQHVCSEYPVWDRCLEEVYPPAAMHVPVLAKPSAQEQLLAGCSGIFGKGLLQLPERPQDATASCCRLVLNSYSELCRPPCFSKCPYTDLFLCRAQNNPRKLIRKELFSPFKNRKGIGKKWGHGDKASMEANAQNSFCMWM